MSPEAHKNRTLSNYDNFLPDGTEFVVFAGDLPVRHTTGSLKAMGVSAKPLKGSYKMQSTGEVVEEDSFIVSARDWPLLLSSGLVDKQESFLFLSEKLPHKDYRRRAKLVFKDDSEDIPLGLLTPVSESQAKETDNWSFDSLTNTYFITEEE